MRAAWRHGRLVMGFVPLRKVISEINRYRRVSVSLSYLQPKSGETKCSRKTLYFL